MKTMKYTVLATLVLTPFILFAKLNAMTQEQIHLAFRLESLIIPAEHTFSANAKTHLLHWIDTSIEGLELDRKRPFCSRRKIDDALDRLKRSREKLTKEDAPNNASEDIAASRGESST